MRQRFALRCLHRRDDGASNVEFALLLPLLCFILLALIELPMVLSSYFGSITAVSNAASTASREARDENFAPDAIQSLIQSRTAMPVSDIDEVWIYKASTTGYPVGQTDFTSCSDNCLRYTYSGGTLVRNGGKGWPVSTINACPGDLNADSVGVYVRAHHDSITKFFPTMSFGNHSAAKFEPVPTHLDAGLACAP